MVPCWHDFYVWFEYHAASLVAFGEEHSAGVIEILHRLYRFLRCVIVTFLKAFHGEIGDSGPRGNILRCEAKGVSRRSCLDRIHVFDSLD